MTDPIRFYLPDGGPETVGSTIKLCMNDEFCMAEIETSQFSRVELDRNTLTLTNQPVPEPTPEPEPEEPEPTIEDIVNAMLGVSE